MGIVVPFGPVSHPQEFLYQCRTNTASYVKQELNTLVDGKYQTTLDLVDAIDFLLNHLACTDSRIIDWSHRQANAYRRGWRDLYPNVMTRVLAKAAYWVGLNVKAPFELERWFIKIAVVDRDHRDVEDFELRTTYRYSMTTGERVISFGDFVSLGCSSK